MKVRLGSSLLLALCIVSSPSAGAVEDATPVLIAPLPSLDTPVGGSLAPYDLNAFFAVFEEGPVAAFETNKGDISVLLDLERVNLAARFIDFATLGEYKNTIVHHSRDGILGGGAVRITDQPSAEWDLESIDPRAIWFMAPATNLFYLRRFQKDGSFDDVPAGIVIAGAEILDVIADLPTYASPNLRLEDFDDVPLSDFTGALASSSLVIVDDIKIGGQVDMALEFELLENSNPESLQAEIDNEGRLFLRGLKAADDVILSLRASATGGASREFTLSVPLIDSDWTGYFGSSEYWGLGWTLAGALGWLYVDLFPWIYSPEHGWLYCAGEGGIAYIVYDKALGWLFMTPWPYDSEQNPLNQYPLVYRYDSDEWLSFTYALNNGERRFWSFKAGGRWVWTFEDEMGYAPPA